MRGNQIILISICQYLTRVFEVPWPWVLFPLLSVWMQWNDLQRERKRTWWERDLKRKSEREVINLQRTKKNKSKYWSHTGPLYPWNRANCTIWIDFELMDFPPPKISDFSLYHALDVMDPLYWSRKEAAFYKQTYFSHYAKGCGTPVAARFKKKIWKGHIWVVHPSFMSVMYE